MKSVIMRAPGEKLEIIDVPKPKLKIGAVLLETIYSEVCGTDCHIHNGRLNGVPYPIIPGHISVGRIMEMNGSVVDCHGVKFDIGDAVGFFDVYDTCGKCWYCTVADSKTKCPYRKVYGVTVGVEDPLMGGWSEGIHIKPNVSLLRLPKNVTPEMYISGGCGLFTGFHAVERAEIKLGDTVVVQGSGPVGIYSAVFAMLSGAYKVIVIGAPKQRLNLTKKFGVNEVFNIETSTEEERLKSIQELTNNTGADVVIEASGNPKAVSEGFNIVRDGGTYIIVGHYTDNGSVKINPHIDINKKHVTVKGCWGLTFSIKYRALKMLDLHHDHFPWEETISAFYGLEKANQALNDVASMSVVKAVISPKITGT